jgi:hypothetical protein
VPPPGLRPYTQRYLTCPQAVAAWDRSNIDAPKHWPRSKQGAALLTEGRRKWEL